MQLPQDQVVQIPFVFEVADEHTPLPHGQITKRTRRSGGADLERLRAGLAFIEIRRFLGASSVNVIEIESSAAKIRRFFRVGIWPGQGRGIMSQVMPEKLAKISEAHARR